jgi:hypothetical protein
MLAAEQVGMPIDPAKPPAVAQPWYSTLDPANLRARHRYRVAIGLAAARRLRQEIKDDTDRLTKEAKELQDQMQAEIATAGGNPFQALTITARWMQKLGPILAKVLANADKAILLAELRLGIMKLLGSYPTESAAQQEAIKSWLTSFAATSHEGGVQRFIDDLRIRCTSPVLA